MRIRVFAALAVVLLMPSGALAASGAGLAPPKSWTDMQRFEYYIGQMSGSLNICRYYSLSRQLKELADLSPYGRKGFASVLSYDGIRAGHCGKIAASAKKVLADSDKLTTYLAAKYNTCPGGSCAPADSVQTASKSKDDGKLAPKDGDTSIFATCRAEADEHIASLPIEWKDIKSVKMINRNAGVTLMSVGRPGHEAWVRLNSCSGWLVVELSPGCVPRQSYTRGDCQIEGIKGY